MNRKDITEGAKGLEPEIQPAIERNSPDWF